MTLNYPALFVTLSAMGLLMAHALALPTIFTIVLVLLIPLMVTACVFSFMEMYRSKGKWNGAELENYDADPDRDRCVSITK